MNDWNSIFDEPSGKRAWTRCVIISIIGITIVTALKFFFYRSETDYNNYYVIWNAASDTLIAVFTGVLGAAILNLFYRIYESSKLKKIKSISYDNLLIDVFKALERVNGRYRKEEHIDLKFSKFIRDGNTLPELVEIKIRYEFKTKLNTPFLQCYILRAFKKEAFGDSDNPSRYSSGTDDKLTKYEFYWFNDETEFIQNEEYKVWRGDYKIYDCFIGPYKADGIKVEESECSIGQELVYTINLPKDIKLNLKDELLIRFTVSFPMEKESILFLTHEFPTKDTEVVIDSSEVMDYINLYTMPVTGAMQVQKQMSMEDGKEFYSYEGWMLPKSGYVVSWWDNGKTAL